MDFKITDKLWDWREMKRGDSENPGAFGEGLPRHLQQEKCPPFHAPPFQREKQEP
jgi:hypothetical protein